MSDIAVVGLDCRFPKADDPAALWKLLLEGSDAIDEIPADPERDEETPEHEAEDAAAVRRGHREQRDPDPDEDEREHEDGGGIELHERRRARG